jgi:hypothetical protein
MQGLLFSLIILIFFILTTLIFIILDAKVLHDDDEFLEQDGILQVGLGEHTHEAGHLHLLQVHDAYLLDALQEADGREQLQRGALDVLLDDEVGEGRAHIAPLVDDPLGDPDEALLRHVQHLLLIDKVTIFTLFLVIFSPINFLLVVFIILIVVVILVVVFGLLLLLLSCFICFVCFSGGRDFLLLFTLLIIITSIK